MQDESRLPWYQRIRRWGQTNLTEDDPARGNIDFWRGQWARTRVQGIIVNCGGIVAYYPSKHGLQYRAATLGDGDYFKAFSDAAREMGIAVVARMDINRATEEFYRAHPDWFCVDRQGNPITAQGRYISCVSGNYYRKYIPDVLTEIIHTYHPVGFADNSWRGLNRNTICYCENCRAQFMEHAGLPLPEAVDWSDPAYRAWVRWGYTLRTRNWDLFNEVTRREGGEDCLWCGMLNADPTNGSGVLGDLKAILSRSKIVFCDHQFRDTLNGFEQNSQNGQLLRLASDENALAPESMGHYVHGGRTFRLSANPVPETRLWMACGMAGGISPWFHHIGGGTRDRRQFETSVPLFAWHEKNERYLYNRKSLANVGLVWSQRNADFYGRDSARERVAFPFRGWTAAMTEARVPFLPVCPEDVTKYAPRIRTLVLPDIAAMSKTEQEAICGYVRAGGSVILSGQPGMLDGEGEPAAEHPLMALLGLSHTGASFGTFGEATSNWEKPEAHTYLHLTGPRHPILGGFEQTDVLGFGGGLWETRSERLAPVAGFIPSFPIFPPEFSWVRETRDDIHPIFVGDTGFGGRCVYFAADIDRCYGRDRLPDHGALLANALRWTLDGGEPVRVDGNGYLSVNLYEQDGARVLHLVNLSGANERPGYCHRFLPIRDIRVTLPAMGDIPSARLLVAEKMIPATLSGGALQLSIDEIVDHEVVVIE